MDCATWIIASATVVIAFATVVNIGATCCVSYFLWSATRKGVWESIKQTNIMREEMKLTIRPFLGIKKVEGTLTDKSIEGFFLIINYGQIPANDVKISYFIDEEDIKKLENVYICPNQEHLSEYKLATKVKNATLKINIDYCGGDLSDREHLTGVFNYNPVLKKFTIVSVKTESIKQSH